MTRKVFEATLRRVSFLDWQPRHRFLPAEDAGLVWWSFIDRDGNSHCTRKWYISNFTCESELIQTMLLAALTAVEHEARERFKVDGVAAYGPHIAVQAHVEKAWMLETRQQQLVEGAA